MLALRKRRMAASHPFLRGGFRPFFFGAAAWAIIAIVLWLGELTGAMRLPTRFVGVAWHRHEMLFGFVGAAIAGFLLTAIPNWTGRLPIAGKPLLGLFVCWATARVAVLFSSILTLWPAAILDVGLFLLLAMLAAREVIASKNRNLPIVAVIFLFGLVDAVDYLDAGGLVSTDVGWRGGIALVILMISMIGGRIIPSFTRNCMVKRKISQALPMQPQSLDLLVIASTALALLFWLAFPDEPLTGGMLVLAAAAQALRLIRWRGVRTTSDPLVFVLHVGYFWVPTGLFLLGLSVAGFDVPQSAGVHALTAGAMTTMILAVMSRASLGHTGRALQAPRLTTIAYACVTAGALARVVVSFATGNRAMLMDLAGTLWCVSLILFLTDYAPVLWQARLGEES
jgi:uncharacterized protein involved in response to NO